MAPASIMQQYHKSNMRENPGISIAGKHLMIALGVISTMFGIIGALLLYIHNDQKQTQEKFNNTMERVIERMETKLSETVIDVAIIKTILKEKEKIDVDATKAEQSWQKELEEYKKGDSSPRSCPNSHYLKKDNPNKFYALE